MNTRVSCFVRDEDNFSESLYAVLKGELTEDQIKEVKEELYGYFDPRQFGLPRIDSSDPEHEIQEVSLTDEILCNDGGMTAEEFYQKVLDSSEEDEETKVYEFPLRIIGEGYTPQEAWESAIYNFDGDEEYPAEKYGVEVNSELEVIDERKKSPLDRLERVYLDNGGSSENLWDFIHTALNYVQANVDDILDLMEEE